MAWFWQEDYNRARTHESIGNIPPAFYRLKLENSNLDCPKKWGVDSSLYQQNILLIKRFLWTLKIIKW